MSRSGPRGSLAQGLIALALLPPLPAQGEEPYSSPIVFQRFANSEANPTIPGFYGGADIWIMEDDGSRLRRIRADSERHLDHPSLTEDLEFVIYAEFEPHAQGPDHKARLLAERIGGEVDGKPDRRISRNLPGCSVHHAAISPVTQELTYGRFCEGQELTLITEINFEIHNVSLEANGLAAVNGVGIENGVVFQAEGPREKGARRAAIAMVGYGGDLPTYRDLTDRRFLHRRPAVSPDGRWLAWQSDDSEEGTDDVFLAKIDGSEPRRLTRSEANDGHPWFSRDGRWIVFESDRSGNWEIFKIEIESRAVVQLTEDPDMVSTRPRY